MIPIVDLKEQYLGIKKDILQAVEKTLDSCQFILGENVKKFEEDVSKYSGTKYAIATANGSDAILLALKAIGVEPGDSVVTSAFTYYATAGAIARCGATPVFCDIDPRTYNISPEKLRHLLLPAERRDPPAAETAKRIKAVIPVHLYGQMADMDEITAIADKRGLKVIEDAAQAFGAEYKGKKAGSIGDAGCFSFYPGKNLGAYGDAGMVITSDQHIDELLRIYRNQGDKGKYKHAVIGHNSRMDALQGAILRVKLRHIDEWNGKRRLIAKFYDSEIGKLGIITPFNSKGRSHIYHLYTLRFKSKTERDRLEKALNAAGIDARTYYPEPLHLQECFKYLGYKKGDFPEAEKACEETLSIPMYPELKKEQQEFIVDVIKKAM